MGGGDQGDFGAATRPVLCFVVDNDRSGALLPLGNFIGQRKTPSLRHAFLIAVGETFNLSAAVASGKCDSSCRRAERDERLSMGDVIGASPHMIPAHEQ